jgi:hypothetical protein
MKIFASMDNREHKEHDIILERANGQVMMQGGHSEKHTVIASPKRYTPIVFVYGGNKAEFVILSGS